MSILAGFHFSAPEVKLAAAGLAALGPAFAWWAYRFVKAARTAPEPQTSDGPVQPEETPQGKDRPSRKIADNIWAAVPGASFEAKLTFLGFLLTAPPALWWGYNLLKGSDIETTGARIEQQQRAHSEEIQELNRRLQKIQDQLGGDAGRTPEEHKPSPAAPDLGADLNAGIDTLLKAGRENALRDKTGESAQAALDQLIADRQSARDRITKDEAALWRQKGAFAFLHDTQAAVQAYAKAAELDPDDAEGWWRLGQLQARFGNRPAAKASFERLLALRNSIADPQSIHLAHILIGDAERELGNRSSALARYALARELIEALAEKDPNNAE